MKHKNTVKAPCIRVNQDDKQGLKGCGHGRVKIRQYLALWVPEEEISGNMIRHIVYDSNSGDKLVDKEVCENTIVRQPFGHVRDA